MIERTKLKTKEGDEIIGDFYPAVTGADTGALMLHMMPSTRKSFASFAVKLQNKDIMGLCIDLRGHGESQFGPTGYQLFSDAEHQKSIFDVEAGVEFLKSKGAKKIYLVGASIGANLALQYLVQNIDSGVKAAVLLSPGITYHGIKIDDLAGKIHRTKAIYMAAANDDTYSFDTVTKLYELVPEGVKRESDLFDTGGHGTKLFDAHPEFMDKLVDWLKGL